jgi:hypothetical protein
LSPTRTSPPGTLPATATSSVGGFVAKWNSAGTYIGAALVDGVGTDQGLSVVCDVRRNVYITGNYGKETASISSFALSPTRTSPPGTLPAGVNAAAGFVAKWTP